MFVTCTPTVGLFGLGAFGRLVLRHLGPRFPVVAHDPASRDSAPPEQAAACDIVILAVPVAAMAETCAAIAPHLRPGAVVVDVGSVKIEPVRVMAETLPPHVQIVGTHPLFGPQSARDGVAGHKIAICPVRGRAHLRIAAFLRRVLRLRVILTTPEEHDREAAVVQGLTHLIARVLVEMEPLPSRMTTASYDRLMEAIDMVRGAPPGVLAAIETANPHARPVRDHFFATAAAVARRFETDSTAPAGAGDQRRRSRRALIG